MASYRQILYIYIEAFKIPIADFNETNTNYRMSIKQSTGELKKGKYVINNRNETLFCSVNQDSRLDQSKFVLIAEKGFDDETGFQALDRVIATFFRVIGSELLQPSKLHEYQFSDSLKSDLETIRDSAISAMTPGADARADFIRDKQKKQLEKNALTEKYNSKFYQDSQLVQTLLTQTDRIEQHAVYSRRNNYKVVKYDLETSIMETIVH